MAAPVAQGPPPPRRPRAVFGRKEAACCLTQSGSSSPWKQLSEPRDAAAALEPVVRAPLLPSGGSRSPGPPWGSRAVFGSQEAVFGAVFLDYIKRVTALQASLDYQSQPTTGKSPKKSPEESSYRRNHGRVIVSVIAKSMTKSKAAASLELSGSIQSCSII